MNKICTDINQSKKLIELGIDINTADMYYFFDGYNPTRLYVGYNYDNAKFYSGTENKYVAAWSLTALLKLTPKSMISTPNPFSDYYCCRNIEFDIEFYADNPIDAAYEMMVWLKENGKL